MKTKIKKRKIEDFFTVHGEEARNSELYKIWHYDEFCSKEKRGPNATKKEKMGVDKEEKKS